MVAQSFSKNFGLYGERVGSLSIVCGDTQERDILQSRLQEIVVPEYLNPPINGAKIVDTILSNKELTEEWKSELN